MSLPTPRDRVLVIKLGALGDFAQAMGPFQAIRKAMPDSHITLLTTRHFADLARRSPWFDEVLVDEKPSKTQLLGLIALRRKLLGARPDLVIDLQTSHRSCWYWLVLMAPVWPKLSGIVWRTEYRHRNPKRNVMHTLDRQAEQLAAIGIPEVPPPDLSWIRGDLGPFDLPERFAIIVPGGSPNRTEKRWPAERFAELARRWVDRGRTPVLIGAPDVADVTREIKARCPDAIDLTGRTELQQIILLAHRAEHAVGNDTGPMHLAAMVGCECTVLFCTAKSNPDLCAPRGASVEVLGVKDFKNLTVDMVADAT